MIVSRQPFFFLLICGAIALASPALAQQVSREQDITTLRLGQRVLVDDGTCPPGQIKQVLGTKMTATGVARVRSCVARVGPKHK